MTAFELKVFCDGGARGNPGKAAFAFAILENDKIIKKDSKFIGITTNNVAEYAAVLNAIRWLSKSDYNRKEVFVTFFLDSELVTRQLRDEYKVKSANLKPFYDEIKNISVSLLLQLRFVNVPRHKNKLADSLVNQTLDLMELDEK